MLKSKFWNDSSNIRYVFEYEVITTTCIIYLYSPWTPWSPPYTTEQDLSHYRQCANWLEEHKIPMLNPNAIALMILRHLDHLVVRDRTSQRRVMPCPLQPWYNCLLLHFYSSSDDSSTACNGLHSGTWFFCFSYWHFLFFKWRRYQDTWDFENLRSTTRSMNSKSKLLTKLLCATISLYQLSGNT